MKILILCTYPIDVPRHGGQIRVSNLADYYQKAGFQVEVVGVSGSESYPESKGFDDFPGASVLASVMENSFLMEDVAIGQLYEANDKYFSSLANRIKQIPDIIHVEQPWLFAFAKRFIKEKAAQQVKLIYGSQNIEYKLKESILNSYFNSSEVAQRVEQVKRIEMQAVKSADGIICVSENDLQWSAKQTGTELLLVPNGVNQWEATDQGIVEANKITRLRKFAFFCASAHPPNMHGFFDMFEQGFGSLSSHEVLVVAGGAGKAISNDPRIKQSARLADSVIPAGMVSSSCLSGLLDTAHCIVLPITQGGGTNLKTAEAIWAGHHIVATSIAMRGFEQFIDKPGIYIADSATEFKQKLRQAMQMPPLKIEAAERERRKVVLWEQCLKPLKAFITKL